ncbi:hypothetical protein AAMO2058_000114600 [Amorphochlora amoebiformis]
MSRNGRVLGTDKCEKPPLTSRQVVQLRRLYDFLEDGKGGLVTVSTLHSLMIRMGFPLKREKVEGILEAYNGSMKFSDFLCFFAEKIRHFQGTDSMTHAFKSLDHDRDGLVRVSRFISVYETLMPNKKKEEVRVLSRKMFNPAKKYNGSMTVEFSPEVDSGLNYFGAPCKVTKVQGPAFKAGIKVGWIIVRVDGAIVEDFKATLSKIKKAKSGGRHFTVELSFEKVP